MEKKELRKLIRQRKNEHTPEELKLLSQRIAASALNRISAFNRMEEERLRAESTDGERQMTVLLYHSLPDEVDTHDLIAKMHHMGYRVLLPTVVGNELELHEYICDSALQTSESFGIQESSGPLFTDYGSIDLAIIPGMGFTTDGKRLGRGKGYYDRLLPHLHCPFIGFAFPFQILEDIPCEAHDIKMKEVIFG